MSRLHAYVVLSLLVGIRTEEARALKWEHLALDRAGDMPPHVVAVLKAHRDRQDAERERAAGRWQDNGLVFCTKCGTELDAGNVRRAFRLVLRDAGLPVMGWTPREMRHSFVSMLSARRVPVEVIADLVGHSGTSVTERVYRLQLRPVITEGAEIMDDIFKADDWQAEEGEIGS